MTVLDLQCCCAFVFLLQKSCLLPNALGLCPNVGRRYPSKNFSLAFNFWIKWQPAPKLWYLVQAASTTFGQTWHLVILSLFFEVKKRFRGHFVPYACYLEEPVIYLLSLEKCFALPATYVTVKLGPRSFFRLFVEWQWRGLRYVRWAWVQKVLEHLEAQLQAARENGQLLRYDFW